MEYNINNKKVLEKLPALSPNGIGISSSSQPFIEANTIPMDVQEMSEQHIIPVWASTNEPLISHSEFIESVWEVVHTNYSSERILKPNTRVSHAVMGRIPEAKHKSAKDLAPWEQTIYYERMMFVIEIPSIRDEVNGNLLSLTIGGVKSYNADNLYSKRNTGVQNFQLFVGFQNKVCCNMCVWTDGLKKLMAISTVSQLKQELNTLLNTYRAGKQLSALRSMSNVFISETEFAQVIGRARMYKHLPEKEKKNIPEMLFGDQQLGAVVNDYYKDSNFGNESGGDISLWRLYNLLTGANKNTYIDSFLERSVNAHDFTNSILKHKTVKEPFWYLG